MKSIYELVTPSFGRLIDDFYAEIENHPDARKVITGGEEQIARLKKTLHRWLHELLSGRYDRDYVEKRWRVGLRHVEIGLDQVYTNAALSRLRGGLLAAVAEVWQGDPSELLLIRESLNRLLDLDFENAITEAVATSRDTDPAVDLYARMVGKLAWSANLAASEVWLAGNATRDPHALIDQAFEIIERGVPTSDA